MNDFEFNGPELYKRVAESLPWGLQTALLTIRDYQDNPEMLEQTYELMPLCVYYGLTELGMVTNWNEEKKTGFKLTKAGKHIVSFCTC